MPGAEVRRVEDLVRSFDSGDLQIPDYQRDYCWSEKKAIHFLQRTKTLGHVLGVITGYRLTGRAAEFLQDGLQRITTLKRAIDKPSKYSLSSEDVLLLKKAQVSYQSMEYESHDLARQDFQHLNDGVGLTHYEKYRGDLEKDEDGKKLYAQIRENTFNLSAQLSGESRATKENRKVLGQLNRYSLGLFYQYAKGHRDMQLYAKSEQHLNDQIERLTRTWLEENIDSWELTVQSYVRALERVNAMLTEKTRTHFPRKWDVAVIRAFYSAYFYCQNIGCTIDNFSSLIDWYVDQNANRKKWQARFEVLYDGYPQLVRIDQINLKWLNRIAKVGGPELIKIKREKKIDAPAGYDESHVIPHADGGTTVFVEPSILNRARGRRIATEMMEVL